MQLSLGDKIGCMSLLRRGIGTEMKLLFVDLNLGYPTLEAFFPKYAKVSGCVIGLRPYSVFAIRPSRHATKIREFVVQRVAVNVVNLARWPFSSAIKPCEAVSKMLLPIETDNDAAIAAPSGKFGATNFLSDSPLSTVAGNAASKQTSFWIVIQNGFQTLLRKRRIALAHLSFLINDNLGSDASGFPPRGVALS